jgi:hypothetical protein
MDDIGMFGTHLFLKRLEGGRTAGFHSFAE